MRVQNIRKLTFFFIAVSISLLHFTPHAQADSVNGAVSSATARAGVAANDDGEQILLNPAAMVHGQSLTQAYFYRGGFIEKSERSRLLGLSMQDNSENLVVTGGLFYGQQDRSFLNLSDYKERRIQISLASFVYKQLSFGASVYNIRRDVENVKEYEFYDGNLGVLWNPNPNFAIGARYDNFAKHGLDVPAHVQLRDQLTIGINYVVMERVRARLDLGQQMEYNPESRADFRLGMESFTSPLWVIRLGYERAQQEDRQYYSAGLGFNGPRLKMDYAYRKNADFSGGALHSVDFRLPF